jgi:cold shock CspA family protein
MLRGSIKRLDAGRGHGFISRNGRNVFFDSSVVEGDQFDELFEGRKVEYELDDDEDEVTRANRRLPENKRELRAAYVKVI